MHQHLTCAVVVCNLRGESEERYVENDEKYSSARGQDGGVV